MKHRFFILCLSALLPALALSSCKKEDPNAERSDYIRAYLPSDRNTPIDQTWVSVRGGSVRVLIESTVPFSSKWQDGQVPAWAEATAPRQVGEGLWEITITAGRMPAELGYERRSGVLMLSAPDQFLGKYLVVNQGFISRVSSDFSWLNGNAAPNETYDDVLMANWTNVQKGKGFTSTVIEGQENAWVYGKAGYIKLGNDDGMGADLFTPHNGLFRYDSLLVLSFKAIVQNGPSTGDFMAITEPVDGDGIDPDPGPGPGPDPGPDPEPEDPGTSGTEPILPMPVQRYGAPQIDPGLMDNGTLTIEIQGGGVLRDQAGKGVTSITFTDLPTYDRESAEYPLDIFKNSSYLVFLSSVPGNAISANTTLRFIAGSMATAPAEKCSRIFLDDVYVYRMNAKVDEDIFGLNGKRSGRDNVLGGDGQ